MFSPWVGKVPWRWKWQPTPVFLPGESHGQRRLADYSPKGCKESDTTSTISLNTLVNSKHSLQPQLNDHCSAVSDSLWPHGSSVHRILQARILEWVTIPFSRGSSWPRDWTWVSCLAGRFFYYLSDWGFGYRLNGSIQIQATCNLLL